MRNAILSGVVVLAVVCLSTPAQPNACGDVDDDGTVDLGDWVRLIEHIGVLPGGNPSINSSADCDNRLGITIGDAERMIRYMFYMDPEAPLDCAIGATYSFPPAPTDTVFLPFMVAIPDEVDSVVLPVMTSFAADTRAFYIPSWVSETNGPGLFTLRRVDDVEEAGNGLGSKLPADTAVMFACEFDEDNYPLTGRHTFYNLVLYRVQPGLAAINCSAVTRTQNLRVSVEKNNDLYAPVIQYYQVPLPTPNVTASPSSLAIEAWSGFWSTQSYQVTFTSDMGPVSFNLAGSDSWIVIEDPYPTGYTTPATITVRANASMLTSGVHNGQIVFSDLYPADAEFIPSALEIVLTTTDPIIYPPGDLNCDGQVSISDVSLLIDCLFIDTRPVPPCE